MNNGFRAWARPRHKVFVGEPQTIDTTNGNKFYHGFGRVPAVVVAKLICVTANNGYAVGDEMPLHILFRFAGGDADGVPYWHERHTLRYIDVWISSSNIRFQDATIGSGVTFTASQWKLSVRCADIERAK